MLPPFFPADDVFNKEIFYQTLDNSECGIAAFILPTVYAGHINHIVWIKPQWANQV